MKPVPLVLAGAVLAFAVARRRRLGRAERALAILLAAGLAVYGSGLVVLPDLEHLARGVGERLGAWTYLLVGVMAFLETGAFVGLVLPGETTILVGGLVAGQGRIDVMLLIAVVWACAVAGDLTSYALGRRLGRSFLERHGPRFRITRARLERVEAFFARYGGAAVLLGRFVGLVRAVAPFIAGASRMPVTRFLPYDLVGAGAWGAALVMLGYVFWQSFDRAADVARKGALALGLVIALGVALVAAARWLRDPAHRRRASAWPVVGPALRLAARLRRPRAPTLEAATLLACGSVGGFGFAALADLVSAQPRPAVDRAGLSVARHLASPPVVDAVKVLTALGSLPVAGAATLMVTLWLAARRRRTLAAAALGAGLGLTVVAVHLAKDAVGRARPPHPLVGTVGESYPSGHAAYAVALVAAAAAIARSARPAGRLGILAGALALAALVGASRLYLRAHWLTDVAGGFGLAAALFSLCGLAALGVERVRKNGGA